MRLQRSASMRFRLTAVHHCVCSRVNVQVRVMVFPCVNSGVIHPTESRWTATLTVTVGVESVIVDGVIVIVLLLIDVVFNTCCAAVFAAAALPPGMIACRQP